MSCQVMLRSIICSHFIQAPCWHMATVLLARSSSTEICTSSCTSLRLSAQVAAHPVPKAFHNGHLDFIYEQRPEDSWEDPVLVDPGLELSRDPDLSTVLNHPSRSALVALMHSVSFRLHLKPSQGSSLAFLWWMISGPLPPWSWTWLWPSLFSEPRTGTLQVWNSCMPMTWASPDHEGSTNNNV